MMLTAWRRSASQDSACNLLFVEPVNRVVELMRDDLEIAGFNIIHASDGPTALAHVRRSRPDVVVLDSVLPGLSGFEMLRQLRREGLPTIWLTRHFDVSGRTAGQKAGAAAVLAMPFGSADLVRHVKAACAAEAEDLSDLSCGTLHLTREQTRLEVGDRPVLLSRAELAMIRVFMSRPGEVVRRTELLEAVTGTSQHVSARAIDKLFMSLCHKLGTAGGYFETVWGSGFRFNPSSTR